MSATIENQGFMTEQEEQLFHQTCFSNQEQKQVIAEQNATIGEIADLIADADNWETSELVAFHRGFILARCEHGLNFSIVGAEPDINPLSDQGTPCADTMNSVRTE